VHTGNFIFNFLKGKHLLNIQLAKQTKEIKTEPNLSCKLTNKLLKNINLKIETRN
jgi:hypothetical protein